VSFQSLQGRQKAGSFLIKYWFSGHRRHRFVRLTAGVAALLLLVWRIEAGDKAAASPLANVLIWGVVFLTVILLVWREKNQTLAHRVASEESARFIAAAETSPDAFFIIDAVRSNSNDIVDFRFIYVNSHAEELLKTTRAKLLKQDLCVLFPINRTSGMFDKYRRVVTSGEPLTEEYSVLREDGTEMWLRQRVNKLGDGLTIRTNDATELKVSEQRYQNLSNFSNSVFENAPFSIIETDTTGIIQAMNTAAERLTGYKRDDLVGKVAITSLHDPSEMSRRPGETVQNEAPELTSFELLTAKAALGEVDEREWTYVRSDGATLPVHVAVTAVKDSAGNVNGFIAIASDITERKQMMTYLNHMASHDQLTGLPGRTLLRERIAEAIEKAMLHGRKVAVFVIDLDHFKRMNDSLGHRAGDEIIVGMAERMRQSLRRSDTLGRLGGDEFIVVMPHIATLIDVERCAKRLVDRVSSTAVVGDMEVNLTASVGVCVYPDFAEDVDSLLERADAATYAAKGNGRNQYQVFSEAMLKESQEKLSMDTALRHALIREELFLHYQPLVSLITGRVIGMEALLRWHHPKLGVISPATFIPLAEETGLIVAIGEWALKRSCQQAKVLCDELGMDLSVSVNLSPRQFEQHNLLQVIDQAIEESGLPARNLQVELTENTLMINSASNLEKLQQIRQLGARVAIDDFGTGFCSFSYLLQYPVDRLKIDQSFVMKAVTEPNAATVVRTIVAMSHHLGIKVIAEGIETPDHLRFLAQRKCDEAQGYYFSRPVAAAGFGAAVAAIHRLFDERKLLDEIRAASADGEPEGYGGTDQELERQGSPFRSTQKQVVM
jgi:diguanylate cyclase (GGDEF)-like protein/PAS domain S-box-containing protein